MQAMEIKANALISAALPVPSPMADELLIRVAYAGVNRADILQIAGDYAPPEGASPLPGLEVSGWVVALGAGVTGFALGQEVCALLSGGGYAQYAVAKAAQTLAFPAGITLKEAAALPEAAATSVMALANEGALKAGERVLIHGASSGVGLMMAQIAKHWGAEVFGIVGSDEKVRLLNTRNINAINHRSVPFGEQVMAMTHNEGVDIIIDTLGGPMLETHLRLLRKNGRLVTLAMLEGSTIPAGTKMTRLLMNHLTWRGATLRSRNHAEKAAIMEMVRANVWPGLANGAISLRIDSCFALADAKKALERMQERLHMGKILLEVAPE
jgi:NADPH:quinone reductase